MPSLLNKYLSRQEAALIVITAVWGATFLIVHLAMKVSGPFFFVGVRFTCAAIAIGLISHKVLRNINAHELVAGTIIGVCICIGYGLQTFGLQTISSSKSAFITALYVPLVPLFQWLIMRRRPHLMSWVGILLAFSGLMFLAGPQDGAFGISLGLGEVLTIISTLGIALEVVFISFFAGSVDIRRVTVVQLIVTALIAFALMPVMNEPVPPFSWRLALSACGLGLMSAIIQLTMNWAQQQVSPTRATVIYAGEPVWAGIIGRIAGERMPVLAVLGGALIVLGVVMSELRPRRPLLFPALMKKRASKQAD